VPPVSLVELLVIGVCLVIGYVVVGSFFDKRYDTPTSGADSNSKRERDATGPGQGEPGQEQARKADAPYEPFGPRWATVLGVPATASKADISAAYKRKISEYHPDKVTQMGPEIRALAEQRSKEINLAYEEALRRLR
jgi:DnaJ like chaperone protein